jgi:uncharacterized protein YutD
MAQIMSQDFVNIAVPVRLRFLVVSGTWTEWEDSDDVGYAWEFTPASMSDPVELEPAEDSDDVDYARESTPAPMSNPVELDPWEVRMEFLGLRHDDRDALRNFLHKTGAFCWINYRPIAETELWQFQAAIRQQLLKPTVSENRIKRATEFETAIHNRIQVHLMNINVGFEDGTLVGEAEALNTFDAILSTIFIDRLRKLRFKVCSRPDCATIYELTSRHKRKFCSYDCAHLMTVRRSRKGKKKKKKNKKEKKNKKNNANL